MTTEEKIATLHALGKILGNDHLELLTTNLINEKIRAIIKSLNI